MNPQFHAADFRPFSWMGAEMRGHACGYPTAGIRTLLVDKARGGPGEH